ncbi:MAG: lysophospholipid acyltransferase family protein [Chthoniobacteraceae bacterium]
MSPWKRFRYRLEELACRGLAWAIPRLSRRALLAFADGAGALACRLDRRGRTVALSNLECVFGARFTPAERADFARRSYQNFARTMLDLFWAARLDAQNWRDWMRPEGFDALRERLARENRGAVFMCVHQGNWEWASLACGFLGFGNVVVAENFKNPRLTELFRARREHSGQTLIAQENSLLRMLKIVKRGGTTGMLIDLNLRPDQAATVIDAHGGLKMCVPMLHAVLAARAGALLVPVETQPQPDGTCRIVAHPPIEVPEGATHREIAQRCWNAMEPIVPARPAEYLWAYKHFRYRPRDPARSYPAYANESGKFEKLLRAG